MVKDHMDINTKSWNINIINDMFTLLNLGRFFKSLLLVLMNLVR